MDYTQFLLSQLLRDLLKEYNKLAYDELYNLSFDIYDIYKKIENQNINLYEDIEKFITNNKNMLLKIAEPYLEE